MNKSIIKTGLAVAALATALVTVPFIGQASAHPPSWAPAHGYRHAHFHHKHKFHHHKRHRHYHHSVRRKVYVTRHYYDDDRHHHYRPKRHRHHSTVSISPATGGAIIGAVLGGLGGSQIGSGSGRTAAIIGGAALGAVVGGHVAHELHDYDRVQINDTLEHKRSGETVIWNNPDTGHRHEVTPTRTYENAGTYCREFTKTVFIGGRQEQAYGTACRMPDGSWQIQNG